MRKNLVMLPFDGTYLGTFDASSVLYQPTWVPAFPTELLYDEDHRHQASFFTFFLWKGKWVPVRLQQYTSTGQRHVPGFIDECKALFGIPKIGLHSLHLNIRYEVSVGDDGKPACQWSYKKTFYIMYRSQLASDGKTFKIPFVLTEKYLEKYKREIAIIYTFRNIMRVKNTQLSDLYYSGGMIFCANETKQARNRKGINSYQYEERLFPNHPLCDGDRFAIIKDIFAMTEGNYDTVLFKLRQNMFTIAKRIDESLILTSEQIYKHLNSWISDYIYGPIDNIYSPIDDTGGVNIGIEGASGVNIGIEDASGVNIGIEDASKT